MRKYLLLYMVLFWLPMVARGQTITDLADIDLSGLPQPTTAKALRYWFDDDATTVQTTNQLSGSHALDVSGLIEGLHTLHYQVIDTEDGVAYVSSGLFLKVAHSQRLSVKSMRYWFDDDAASVQSAGATTGTYTLDVANLIEGLHTLHYQLIDESGLTAYVGSSIFLKINNQTGGQVSVNSLRYWFDDDQVGVKTLASAGTHTLDVSALLDGLHTIHYQVKGSDGQVHYIASALFLKAGNSFGTETVKAQKLLFWFDDETTIQQADISEGTQVLDASGLIEGLHTLHYQVLCNNGQMTPASSSIFLRMTIDEETAVAKSLRYWFDDEQTATEVEITEGVQQLDASGLIEGLHTVHYQIANSNGTLGAPYSSIFLMMNWDTATSTAKSLRYWFDDETTVSETAIANGTQTLDASRLIEGLHTVHYQIVDNNGTLGAPASSVFLKMNYDNATATAKSIRYWFDDDVSTVKVTDVANGTQTLDVSALETGLHTLNYQLIDSNDRVSVPVTRLFLKNFDKVLADGHNRVTKYQYWLNTNSQAMKTVELDAAANPYTLIALLPMQKEPLQSSQFHFEVTNDVPTIYAKNTLHVRFYDAQNYFTDGDKPFVDYSVKQEIEPVGELQATQTFDKIADNDIRWYTLQAEEGDSVQFKLDRTATLHLFAPSGKEVFSASGSQAVKWDGCHAEENGTFYLAVHDVTAVQRNSIRLDYEHIDKYAVLQQDVAVVGNRDSSIVTFYGNGFDELLDVLLVQGPDTLHAMKLGHESNATTSVMFNFDNVTLGLYQALFRFVDGDLIVNNCITVEEATDIDIDVEAIFNRNNLISFHKTKYIFSVHNNGNVTAYDVPLMIRVYTHDAKSLERVDVEGYDLAADFKNLLGEHYTDSLANAINAKRAVSGDRCFFLEADSTDIIAGWAAHIHQCFVILTIPPNSTKDIIVSLELGQSVYCYMWHPEEGKVETVKELRAKVRRRAGGFTGICGRDIFFHRQYCQERERYYNALNTLDGAPYPSEDCSDWSFPMPCPGDGGNSSGDGSHDPNDIKGYLSEAGSKFIPDSIQTLDYAIEFENDTTFSTASAHKVIVCDTLDSRYFDFSTFVPTLIKIGDKEVRLDGTPNFVKTIDMRPEIYAIAQVEGTFNQTKGIATWTFTSLDPMTMEPTDDFMSGFLPVNYDGKSGIGEVFFNINLKQQFADGTEIPNRAGIVFDQNEPIMTPTWVNTVDAVAPTSTILGGIQTNDSTLTLRIAGEDARSGVWKYNVYAQMGQGASWDLVAENVQATAVAEGDDTEEGETETLVDVRIYDGIEYSFLVLATDSAGNVERKSFEEADFQLTTVMPGDANGDGTVDALDVVLATSYYLCNDVYLNFAAADVVADGEINSLDVVAMQNIYLNATNGGKALVPRRRVRKLKR